MSLVLHGLYVAVFTATTFQLPAASAQDAKAVITAPAAVGIGDLFVLDGTQSQADALQWTLFPTGKTFLPVEDNKRVVFSSGTPGTYTFILSVAKGGTVSVTTHSFTVGQPGPQPPPNPGPQPPGPAPGPAPVVPPTTKVTAATYVYEKDATPIPSLVMVGLNKLNRELKIVATIHEVDSTDGTDQIPEQHKVSVAAAKSAGLPALVVMSGQVVFKVVKNPSTLAQITEAVK